MPPQEQADLWMALRDRMKNDWHELTVQERKAGMFTFRRPWNCYGVMEKAAGCWLVVDPSAHEDPLVREKSILSSEHPQTVANTHPLSL